MNCKMMSRKLILAAAAAFVMASPAWAEDAPGKGGMEDGSPHRGRQTLEKLDTDGDGKISKAEFMVKHEERFARMDKDSDGFISKDEMQAAREAMKARREEARKKREEGRAPHGGEGMDDEESGSPE